MRPRADRQPLNQPAANQRGGSMPRKRTEQAARAAAAAAARRSAIEPQAPSPPLASGELAKESHAGSRDDGSAPERVPGVRVEHPERLEESQQEPQPEPLKEPPRLEPPRDSEPRFPRNIRSSPRPVLVVPPPGPTRDERNEFL